MKGEKEKHERMRKERREHEQTKVRRANKFRSISEPRREDRTNERTPRKHEHNPPKQQRKQTHPESHTSPWLCCHTVHSAHVPAGVVWAMWSPAGSAPHTTQHRPKGRAPPRWVYRWDGVVMDVERESVCVMRRVIGDDG